MAAKQNVFVMVKPDGVARKLTGEIISRFEKKGFDVVMMRLINHPDRSLVEEHYAEHKGKNFYEGLVEFISNGPVVAMMLLGNVQVARKITGVTLPWEASPGTIRGDYACVLNENLVHCSDSVESANRECKLWFTSMSGC